jgi:tetratricopeptide (TPR) repeat protein
MEASNAIRQAPREAPGYLFRSIAYAQKGTFDNALADLDKCDELNPTALIATSLVRGFVYIAMGQKARAIDALQRFLDLARQAGVPEQATAVARQALDELRAGK